MIYNNFNFHFFQPPRIHYLNTNYDSDVQEVLDYQDLNFCNFYNSTGIHKQNMVIPRPHGLRGVDKIEPNVSIAQNGVNYAVQKNIIKH